ncbi:MAG: hypothetical protein N2512_11925 [Armatimonadetes bacterium]|nr:hypothetical protein [Armatimonadota bacterium]
MLNRVLSATVLVVLVLVVAAALLSYYRMAVPPAGTEEAPASSVPGLPEGSTPSVPPDSGVPLSNEGASALQAEPVAGPPSSGGEDERASLILELALASLPGWEGTIIEHDENWTSATVRATSPDGKVKLDIRLSWERELGDYEVISATPAVAPKRSPARTSAVPEDVVEAIVSRPTFAALPNRRLIPKQVTENAAVIVVQGGGSQWRVTLERREGKWVLSDTRKLKPAP